MNNKSKKILIILNVVLILIDQLSKMFILFFYNTQISFSFNSIFNSSNIVYIITSITIISALIRYILRDNQFIKMSSRIILSFAIAGAIGNTIDRLWYANVITINFKNAISLNLGYIYVCIAWIGMAVILTLHTSRRMKEKRRNNERNSSK